MARHAHRIHRLPQPLDFALIPAPLDINLPASEKSPLPSIIVTPSSPSTPDSPFFIAFLAPPRKPSLRERIAELTPSFPFKLRTMLILLVLLVVVFCHVLTHRLAVLSHTADVNVDMHDGAVDAKSSFVGWLCQLTSWEWSSGSEHNKRALLVSEMAMGV